MLFIVLILFMSSGILADDKWDYLCEGLPIYTKTVHPYDCTKYFQCMDGGEAFPGECQPGTAFDIKLQNCLPESMVSCDHISSEAPSTTESGGSNWDYLCEGLPLYSMVPHPTDCTKFFQCMDNGEAFPGECPPGTAYDIKIQACLPESMVSCDHITTKQPTSTVTVPELTTRDIENICIGLNNMFIPHPDDFGLLIFCENGRQLSFKGIEGFVFDAKLLRGVMAED